MREVNKDNVELELEKQKLINQLKNIKKEDIIPLKPKKLTLWQRIRKVLMI
jgi:hypothetical protein